MATTITANGINFPDGSAGSPSIGGTDTNTGLFTGSDIVGFATGGSERLRIDASGNINIANDSGKLQLGTSADLQLYHDGSNSWLLNDTGNLILKDLTDAIYIQAPSIIFNDETTNENIARFISDGACELYHDNALRLDTMTEGVKVKRHGGGSTTLYVEGAEGGSAILDMYADDGDDIADKFRLNASSDGTFYMQNYANNGWQSNITYTGAGNVELYHNGTKKFETTSSGATVTGQLNVTGVLKFDNSTNSGLDIRWEPSSNSLDFVDNVKARFGSGADLQIYHDGSNSHFTNSTGYLLVHSVGGDSVIRSNNGVLLQPAGGENGVSALANGAVELYYNNTKQFETGNHKCSVTGVLHAHESLGDAYYDGSNPYHILQSNNEGSVALVVEHSGNTQPYGMYMYFSDYGPDNHSQYFIGCGDPVNNRFRVWSDGDVENHDNSYGGMSDVKLKENIVDAKSQWDDIKAIKVRNFNFKSDKPSDKRLGVIAQEIESISPALVVEHPDLDKDNKDLGTTTKSVKYSILYMKAIKCLQEAMAKIETLEAKVAALEAE